MRNQLDPYDPLNFYYEPIFHDPVIVPERKKGIIGPIVMIWTAYAMVCIALILVIFYGA